MVGIVTGGSKGIGLAIARAFLARGMQVAIAARQEADLAGAARALGSAGPSIAPGAGPSTAPAAAPSTGLETGSVLTVRADVRDPGDAQRLVDETVRRFGGVDVLVNNAGVGRFGNVADMSLDDWRRTIDTNLSGVFYCSRAVIPVMKARGAGFIINISSLAGKNAFAGGAAYCASKAGVNQFSEALMQEVRDDNIRVSCVMPGSVSTGFGDHGASDGADWKLTPDDIARVVVDLVAHDPRSLPSRVEIRPSRPRKG